MTVSQFEDSGKKLADGDLYINLNGDVIKYAKGYGLGVDRNPSMNEGRFILKAKALEEAKTYRYEKVTDYLFDLKEEFERGELYAESDKSNYLKVETDALLASALLHDKLYRRIEVTERELFIEEAQKLPFNANPDALGQMYDAGFRFVNGKG